MMNDCLVYKRNPDEVTENDLKQFLTFLAAERHVSESTQKIAFNALLMLYRFILEVPITTL